MLFGDIFEGENIQEDCYNSTTLISNLGVSQYWINIAATKIHYVDFNDNNIDNLIIINRGFA